MTPVGDLSVCMNIHRIPNEPFLHKALTGLSTCTVDAQLEGQCNHLEVIQEAGAARSPAEEATVS